MIFTLLVIAITGKAPPAGAWVLKVTSPCFVRHAGSHSSQPLGTRENPDWVLKPGDRISCIGKGRVRVHSGASNAVEESSDYVVQPNPVGVEGGRTAQEPRRDVHLYFGVHSPMVSRFATLSAARSHCPADTIVRLDRGMGVYRLLGQPSRRNERHSQYGCRAEAEQAGYSDAR